MPPMKKRGRKPKVLLPKKKVVAKKSPAVKIRIPVPARNTRSSRSLDSPNPEPPVPVTQTVVKRQPRVSITKSVRTPSHFKAVMTFHKMKRELLPILFTRLLLCHPDATRMLEVADDDEDSNAEE